MSTSEKMERESELEDGSLKASADDFLLRRELAREMKVVKLKVGQEGKRCLLVFL